jgi:hypothetical protein
MRKILLLLTVLLMASVVLAQDSSVVVSTTDGSDSEQATQLAANLGGLSLGYLKVGTEEVANLAWHPDFKFGAWGLGADVNVALAQDKPPEYDDLVLRYVEYDDSKKGLRYGIIQNLTWGHGMLMRNYSTVNTGPVLLNNRQLAIKAYLDMDAYVVRVLKTGSNIHAIRLEERVHPMLTLGQTYITDADGVTLPGTSETQKVSAVGLDATAPLPWGFEGYAEYAHLVDHGSGFSSGVSWGADFFVAAVSFLTEYRFLDSNFVPGYFDSDYEVNPINLSSAEATGNVKNGYLAEMKANVMDMASAKLVYENYNESDAAVEGGLFARLPRDVEVTGYYKQPKFVSFRSLTLEEGAIMGGSVAYPVNPFTKIVVHYKKVYNNETQQVEESQYYELRLSF